MTAPPEIRARSASADVVGTTRGLRRPERKPRSLFVSLVVDHFWSKIVALLFAGVIVVLIDRELAVVLFEGDLPVRVAPAGDAAAAAGGRNELLLLTEDGVAVHRLGAAKARVVIRGRRKLAGSLTGERGVVGRAYVRRSWLAGGYTSRILEGPEFDVGAPVESVRLERALQVDFDAEIEAELRLEASCVGAPPGLTPSVVFTPPTAKAIGASAWLAGAGAVTRAVTVIDCAGKTGDFDLPIVPWPEDLARKFVRPAGPTPRARVTFAAAEDATLTIEGVALRHAGFQPELEFSFLPPVDASKPSVTVVLRGAADRIAPYRSAEKIEELRRTLVAQIDVDALARRTASYLDDPSSAPPTETPAIEVLRIPDGLRFDHADRVEVSVKKRRGP